MIPLEILYQSGELIDPCELFATPGDAGRAPIACCLLPNGVILTVIGVQFPFTFLNMPQAKLLASHFELI